MAATYAYAILLGLIPVLNFCLSYYLAKKSGRLALLGKNYALTYLDWLFVPFNFLLLYSIYLSPVIFLVSLAISAAGNLHVHLRWLKIRQKPVETRFFSRGNSPNTLWSLHLVFSTIQAALVLTSFFSRAVSADYYLLMLPLFLYLLSYILIIRYVRRVEWVMKLEMPFVFLGMVSLVARVVVFGFLHI
jgi:hypothetical protein